MRNLHDMNKRIVIMLSLAIISLMTISCAKKVAEPIYWQSAKVGEKFSKEAWPEMLPYYNSKLRMNYSVTNDSHNLYICIRSADNITKMKIIRGGMEIGIDSLSGNKFPVSMTYPIQAENTTEPTETAQEPINNNELPEGKHRKHFMPMANEILLNGFHHVPNGKVPLKNIYGISASIGIDSTGTMFYQSIIPMKYIMHRPKHKKDTLRTFGIMFKIKGLAMHKGHSGTDGEEMDNSRSGGGMGRGGMNSGMGGGMPGGSIGSGGYGGGMPGGRMGGGMGSRGGMQSASAGMSDEQMRLSSTESFRILLKPAYSSK